mmetsp:Transcript_63676/g.205157  ORF Transcript_63676/g.205157 Transcript_63676/m.205157 type:complete len:215 (-) Transcript_63676:181-825(-)
MLEDQHHRALLLELVDVQPQGTVRLQPLARRLPGEDRGRLLELRQVRDEVDEAPDGELQVVLLLQHPQPAGPLLLQGLCRLLLLLRDLLHGLFVLLAELGLVTPAVGHHLLHVLELPLELCFLRLALGLREAGGPAARTRCFQLLLQLLDLRLEPRDLRGLLVLCRLDLDGLGAVGVAQRRHRLVVVAGGRRERRKHAAEGVPAQRLLQHTREL